MNARLKHTCALAESIGNLEGMLTDRHRETCVIPARLHPLFDRAIANMKAAQDFIHKTPDAGQPKCSYCKGDGIIPGPLLEVYDCPVCRPTTTTAGAVPN